MIQSMTGYGKADIISQSSFTVELKSLNSKQIDVSIKIPPTYREKELYLRKIISQNLQRGKIELSIFQEKKEGSSVYKINKKVLKDYYEQINKIKKSFGIKWNLWRAISLQSSSIDIIPTLLKMPDVIQKGKENIEIVEWEEIEKTIYSAIEELIQFRKAEGSELDKDIRKRINSISKELEKISPFDKVRKKSLNEKLNAKLSALSGLDENRLEQELIYYLEKQDITEEQIRLKTHLTYFIKNMDDGSPIGKKLGFIT